VEIAVSTPWGGEDFNWPRANFLEAWGQDGFFIQGIEYGRGYNVEWVGRVFVFTHLIVSGPRTILDG